MKGEDQGRDLGGKEEDGNLKLSGKRTKEKTYGHGLKTRFSWKDMTDKDYSGRCSSYNTRCV